MWCFSWLVACETIHLSLYKSANKKLLITGERIMDIWGKDKNKWKSAIYEVG